MKLIGVNRREMKNIEVKNTYASDYNQMLVIG